MRSIVHLTALQQVHEVVIVFLIFFVNFIVVGVFFSHVLKLLFKVSVYLLPCFFECVELFLETVDAFPRGRLLRLLLDLCDRVELIIEDDGLLDVLVHALQLVELLVVAELLEDLPRSTFLRSELLLVLVE